MKKFFSALIIVALVLTSLVACGDNRNQGSKNDKLKIVASVFPIYDWVSNVVKDDDTVELTLLVKNGTDLHSYQPSAADMLTILDADVFIYVGGESDDWAREALKNSPNKDRVVISLMDVLGSNAKLEEELEGAENEGHDHEEAEYDEHVWLSLKNAKLFVKEIASKLESKNSKNSAKYAENARLYIESLEALDKKYAAEIAKTELKTLLFADRFPFRYLLEDYGISYYAAFMGCAADTEASFKTITFLAAKLDELGLPVVLRIDGSSDKLAETVIAATASKNQRIMMLDSMQSVSALDMKNGATYLSTMEKNLTTIVSALAKAAVATPTLAPTATAKPTPTATVRATSTPAPTEQATPTTEPDPTAGPTVTEEPGPTVTEEPTPTAEPTATDEPTPTETPTPSPEPTATATATPTPTKIPTSTVTPTPTKAPTSTSKPTNTPTPTQAPTSTPKPTNTPTPTQAPTSAPKPTNTPIPTNTAAPTATNTPTPVPTSTPTPTPQAELVSFTDKQLEAAVCKALGKNSGDITKNDIVSVSSLDLTNRGVTSIADLAGFTGLKSLKLDTNSIKDFSVLKSLTNLEELSAGETGFKDLSVLQGLTKLKKLWLFDNGITDISALSALTGLTELDLNYNSITNISALKNLTSLSILNLTGNGLSDISSLSALAPQLDSLWLGFNKISNISALGGAKKTAYINLVVNNVSDWSPVAHVSTVAGRP